MRLLISMITTLFAVFLLPLSSAAQSFPTDMGDIFGKPTPPYQTGEVYIENIPVIVSFDGRDLPAEARLIVTAEAAPKPNERRARPLLMGKTELPLSSFQSPLQMVVAVPSNLAREAEYAILSAKIVTWDDVVLRESHENGQYNGKDPAFIDFAQVVYSENPTSGTNRVTGRVELLDRAQLYRGGTLVLRVMDNALAGGNSLSVVQEERISIDQKNPPFDFDFRLNSRDLTSPQLDAFIEDWAGRRLYSLPRPVSLNGNTPLNLLLSRAGSETSTPYEPNVPLTPQPVPAQMRHFGEVQFDANRGLPRGSLLTVRLREGSPQGRIINDETIRLDGKSGYIDYDLNTDRQSITGSQSYYLDADISDRSGTKLFETRQPVMDRSEQMDIRLEPTSRY